MREPGNPVDPNAIAVIRICRAADGRTDFGELLGHLSKEIARELAQEFDNGPVGIAEILEITGDLTGQEGGNAGVNIRAEIYLPEEHNNDKSGNIDASPRRRPRTKRPVAP